MNQSIPWRMGANIRELAYYGEPGTDYAPRYRSLMGDQLQKLREIGVQVVRFYAPYRDVKIPRALELIGETLNLLSGFDMQAVVCLADTFSKSGHYFSGDVEYHTIKDDKRLKLEYWVNEQYKHHYLPFVKAVVDGFKDHKAVLIWELGNEHAVVPKELGPEIVYKGSQAFLDFTQQTTDTIRNIDPKAIVGTGLVHSRHVYHETPREKHIDYSRALHKTVDAASVHVYKEIEGENAWWELDATVAEDLGKLLYVGELGAHIALGINRPEYFDKQIQYWRDRGAFMVMPWSFNGTTVALGDDFGVSTSHSDYHGLVEAMKNHKGSTTPFNRG